MRKTHIETPGMSLLTPARQFKPGMIMNSRRLRRLVRQLTRIQTTNRDQHQWLYLKCLDPIRIRVWNLGWTGANKADEAYLVGG